MAQDDRRAAQRMLIAGAVILALSLGIRHTFGLFLQPISMSNGWGRETFALAMAVQNIVWGAAQPFTGLLADRIGAGRVILVGAVLYALGLLLMAQPLGATAFVLCVGGLIGLGLSCTTFPIVFGAVGRAVPSAKRSVAMGIVMSVASFGQFIMLPGALAILDRADWPDALIVFACLSALIIPLAFMLLERSRKGAAAAGPSALEAIREALAHRGFRLLSLGFFVCGFQVVLIATHLPAFLADKGLPVHVATTVLALVGLLNIAGTYLAGLWGGRMHKPRMLVWIYLGRALAAVRFCS